MGYEVDFIAVESGGAAISVRWGIPGHYRVLVYDGGNANTGERVVAHVRRNYMCSRVDYLVSSHPAADHAEGLGAVLRDMEVGELWMHRPWLHGQAPRGVAAAREIEEFALALRIPVHEPFAGARIGPFTVLSPCRDWYAGDLLQGFGKHARHPDRIAEVRAAGILAFLRATQRWFGRWAPEPLRWDATTTAENESSAVLYAVFDGRGVLLTGRAGVQALDAAADHAAKLGIDLPGSLQLFQVPNHGSVDNLSSRVLDRILGPQRPPAMRNVYAKSAFISLSQAARGTVSRTVTEALKRRGVLSFATDNSSLHHGHEMPERGWRRAAPATREPR